jgi:ferredoxin
VSGSPRVSLRYFTGTGNSKRIADLCADAFTEAGWSSDIAAIPGGGPPAANATAACFVFPVYSLDLPRIAKRYLESLPPTDAIKRPALFLVTGGDPDDCGWSLLTGRRILMAKGYDLRYADLIHMPNNWGPFMKVPGKEEAATILASGESKTAAAARAFIAGERFEKALHLTKFGPLGSGLMRLSFKHGVKRLWSRFKTNGDCSSCGLCARSCPTGSIVMDGGHPRWSKSCEQCMRCFNLCPSRAILQLESIGKGSTRERWIEPHFQP